MWNLQPLTLLIILCTLSTAQLPLCDQKLGIDINARDCIRALATLRGGSLSPLAFSSPRFFNSRARDRAYLLPQEATYGSCKVAIRIQDGCLHAKSSWRDLSEWTHRLISFCAIRLVGFGGHFFIDRFVIRISRSDPSAAAGAAAVLTPAALRQAANRLSSLSSPAGHGTP